MGERKGVNKYYPPDYDPSRGGLNKWQGTHALRERARKLHLGILVIRFEMPYNIWCDGCGNHIGMGVRYNAEKSKIGMYYTTPVYQFRMKCHLCDNYFVIKTDPANLDYVVVSGARRQERRFDPAENGTVVPEERSTIQKLATDSMFRLEHGAADADKGRGAAPALARLEHQQDRLWDDFAANKRLRDKFRAAKKAAAAMAARDSDLLRRSSLNIALVEEAAEDKRLASLIRLRDPLSMEERRKRKRDEISGRPALGTVAPLRGGFTNQPVAERPRSAASIGVRRRSVPASTSSESGSSSASPTETVRADAEGGRCDVNWQQTAETVEEAAETAEDCRVPPLSGAATSSASSQIREDHPPRLSRPDAVADVCAASFGESASCPPPCTPQVSQDGTAGARPPSPDRQRRSMMEPSAASVCSSSAGRSGPGLNASGAFALVAGYSSTDSE